MEILIKEVITENNVAELPDQAVVLRTEPAITSVEGGTKTEFKVRFMLGRPTPKADEKEKPAEEKKAEKPDESTIGMAGAVVTEKKEE